MTPIETFDVDGYTVNLYRDEDVERPDEYDESCFVVTTRNREFEVHPCIDNQRVTADDVNTPEIQERFEIFPLYAYIHSGVALSLGRGYPFSDPWDSGQIGFVLIDRNNIPEQRAEVAAATVEQWNQWLSGDVYGYEVVDAAGNDFDSCWGFYGHDYAVSEAKSAAAYEARQERESEAECARMFAL